MIKIILLLASIGHFLLLPAQQQPSRIGQFIPFSTSPGTFMKKQSPVAKTSSTPISGRYSPLKSVLTYNGKDSSNMNDMIVYLTTLYVDSTVRLAHSPGIENIHMHKAGTTFDPKSVIYSPAYSAPLFSPSDNYILDTLWLTGQYNRVSVASVVDTLLIEVVWGDETNTAIFDTLSTDSVIFIPGNTTQLGDLLAPKYSPSPLHGNTCFLSAPATNRRVIKHRLFQSDTLFGPKEITVALSLYGGPITLSGNEVVSVSVSFICGESTTPGDIVFSIDPGTPAVKNGFALLTSSQYPPPTTPQMIMDYFDDPNNAKNGSYTLFSDMRYGMPVAPPFNEICSPAFASGHFIDFGIHGTSTSGCQTDALFQMNADTNNPGNYYAYNLSTGTGSLSYLWDFGDGNTSTLPLPSHQYAVPGQYVICLTTYGNYNGATCSDTYCDSSSVQKVAAGFLMSSFSVIPQGSVGVPESIQANLLKIYPNPFEDKLILENNTSIASRLKIRITDAIGRIVHEDELNGYLKTIDSRNFDKGIYLLTVFNEKGQTLKVCKLIR